jgi:hypothetical protein
MNKWNYLKFILQLLWWFSTHQLHIFTPKNILKFLKIQNPEVLWFSKCLKKKPWTQGYITNVGWVLFENWSEYRMDIIWGVIGLWTLANVSFSDIRILEYHFCVWEPTSRSLPFLHSSKCWYLIKGW